MEIMRWEWTVHESLIHLTWFGFQMSNISYFFIALGTLPPKPTNQSLVPAQWTSTFQLATEDMACVDNLMMEWKKMLYEWHRWLEITCSILSVCKTGAPICGHCNKKQRYNAKILHTVYRSVTKITQLWHTVQHNMQCVSCMHLSIRCGFQCHN